MEPSNCHQGESTSSKEAKTRLPWLGADSTTPFTPQVQFRVFPLHSIGWNYLVIHTNPDYSNEDQAYAAGLLEGYLTRKQIYTHVQNQHYDREPRPKVKKYFDENEIWDNEQKKSGKDRLYWHHKNLLDIQVDGIIDGYFRTAEESIVFLVRSL